MDRIEHARIEAALAVLAEARDNAKHAKQQTKGVQLALRVLRGHVPDNWLTHFWEDAGGEHEIGDYVVYKPQRRFAGGMVGTKEG